MSTMHGAHPIPRFSERPPDLSSRKEIEDGIELATRVYESELVKVAFITDSVVVKYGSRVQLWEAQNMHHVASLPHMRVPKVFDAWETEEIGYIVMEYIDGRSLRDIWPVIPLDQRLDIYRQTQSMIEVLRQHKLSQPGPIGGGPSNRQTFFTEEGSMKDSMPAKDSIGEIAESLGSMVTSMNLSCVILTSILETCFSTNKARYGSLIGNIQALIRHTLRKLLCRKTRITLISHKGF
jgi:hypothetical protein